MEVKIDIVLDANIIEIIRCDGKGGVNGTGGTVEGALAALKVRTVIDSPGPQLGSICKRFQ